MINGRNALLLALLPIASLLLALGLTSGGR